MERLARLSVKTLGTRFALLLTASYGLLYYSYKYLQPELGVGDSHYYYPMFRAPLNFTVAQAPFVLRQLSAVLTWAVWRAHIYYPNQIVFSDPGYDQHVFFAALLVNYIALLLTALATGLIAEELLGRRNGLVALLASLICVLSFHTQSAVITDMVEGPAWLLVTLAFLCSLRRSGVWLGVVLVLAIFQRELVLLAVGFFAALDVLPWKVANGVRRFRLQTLAGAVACFTVYLMLRKVYAGWDFQTQPGAVARGLFDIEFNFSLLFQVALSQNVLFLALAAAFAARDRVPAVRYWFPKILAAFLLIVLISLAAYERYNSGRLAGILTPMFAAFAAVALNALQGGEGEDYELPGNNRPAYLICVGVPVLLVLLAVVPGLHYGGPHRVGVRMAR